MEKRDLHIQTSYGRNGVNVQISEANSRHAIVDFQLTPAQVFEFITGNSLQLGGEVITPQRAAQLGYHHSVFIRSFKAEHYQVATAVRENDLPASWKTWKDALQNQMWASSVSFGARSGGGIVVTVRRYDAQPLTDEMRVNVQHCLDSATPPEGLMPYTTKGAVDL